MPRINPCLAPFTTGYPPLDASLATVRPTDRWFLGDVLDTRAAALALAEGAVVAHGFANFYVITTRADAATVRRVNLMKGRPADQVGSITVPRHGIPDLFDWSRLPAGVRRERIQQVIDTFYGLGPFGFRGPAARHVPRHLSYVDDTFGAPVRTAQVIAPGYRCRSNSFLSQALQATGDDLLYITSANRSRHLTGADDSPAHWRAAGLVEEFGHEPDFRVLEHLDEAAARRAYPAYDPMSTTILAFHASPRVVGDDRPQLVLDRHGSMPADDVRAVLDDLGFGLVVGPKAHRRLELRGYDAAVA